VQLHEDLTKLAVMWLLHALLNIHKFWNLAAKPIDTSHHRGCGRSHRYPASTGDRTGQAHGIPVFYYGVPQLWRGRWRSKNRRSSTTALCKLPLKPAVRDRGCNAHIRAIPISIIASEQLDAAFVERLKPRADVSAILPGSRTKE